MNVSESPNFNLSIKGDLLIVDDVSENLHLLFEILSEQGHEVRRVLSAQQALQIIDIDPPDLILLDIRMPVMDGYEMCRILKNSETTKNIPVIFLSALNDVQDKVKAFSVGGVDYINKPFEMQEVLVRVDNQLKLLYMTRQLEQKNKELELINKELESFNYTVSHDLRRPLTRIHGFGELLKSSYANALDEEAREYLDIIYQSSVEMNHIIQDLFRLSQIKFEAMTIETVNLSKLVQDILALWQRREPERNVNLLITPDVEAIGDRRLLNLVLENLLENAWKYSSKKELTYIEFGQIDESTYYVRDQGIGFDMAEKDQLFIPFQRLTTAKNFDGTGIGLSTVQRILYRHHGDIWAESKPDEGTTFFFTCHCNFDDD